MMKLVSGSQKSPLSRLVLFMICLSMLGALVAAIHAMAVGMPLQGNQSPPENGDIDCENCNNNIFTCQAMCYNPLPGPGSETCIADCNRIYQECRERCPG